MVQYLGNQIIGGALDYSYVVTKRPDLKAQLDTYLTDKGYANLIK